MKIHPAPQGSVEWMQARSQIPTASEMDNLVTPEGKVRTGQMVQTYVSRKLAERWLGGALAGFNVFDMDQGRTLEEEARPWLALELNAGIQEVGLITNDEGTVGCSPDGLIGDVGVEIKCPQPQTHVGYLVNGTVPNDYVAQVQCAMFVTGWKKWRFLSYCRRFPALLLTVERDEEFHESIQRALAGFWERFEAGWTRMVDLNGGEPPKQVIPTTQAPEPKTMDLQEIIP